MTDRDFWLMIRRALLMVVAAIEKKWKPKKASPPVVDPTLLDHWPARAVKIEND